MVVGVDGRGSGVTFVLQASIETLVHLSVVPIKATAYTKIFLHAITFCSRKKSAVIEIILQSHWLTDIQTMIDALCTA